MQLVRLAFSLATVNTGRSSAAKIAMMAMTTSSSISVNPVGFFIVIGFSDFQ
jgi:hypothetical protein